MPLKITLKPGERMIISGAVITNGKSKTDLYIENKVPILRQKDVMAENEADTPARRIYFTIQLMYIDNVNMSQHHGTYWNLVQAFIDAAPSALEIIDQINEEILGGRHYQAMKLARKLIEYEDEVISRV